MALSAPTLSISNASDAAFRAWIAGIHTALAAIGLVQTADTGQINTGTVLAPTAANQNRGFSMWRLADALQTGSTQVFFRFEFGSGNATASPGITFQAGVGTDGAGTLTYPGQKFATMFTSASTGATCYFSGDTDRFVMCLRHTAGNYAQVFFLERLKDSTGANTSLGFVYGASGQVMSGGFATGAVGNQVHEFLSTLPAPYTDSFMNAHFFGNAATSTAWNNNVALVPLLGMGSRFHNPACQVWGYLNNDITNLSNISTTIYGVTRSLLAMGEVYPSNYVTFQNTASRILIANW